MYGEKWTDELDLTRILLRKEITVSYQQAKRNFL